MNSFHVSGLTYRKKLRGEAIHPLSHSLGLPIIEWLQSGERLLSTFQLLFKALD